MYAIIYQKLNITNYTPHTGCVKQNLKYRENSTEYTNTINNQNHNSFSSSLVSRTTKKMEGSQYLKNLLISKGINWIQ
jgi:hypothetical protein